MSADAVKHHLIEFVLKRSVTAMLNLPIISYEKECASSWLSRKIVDPGAIR